ncbi:MAG TPA: hypothetical protein VK559_01095 [Ferruginibacter sp.]|nr:hypothetical protein [Ferruginibacter sp.]
MKNVSISLKMLSVALVLSVGVANAQVKDSSLTSPTSTTVPTPVTVVTPTPEPKKDVFVPGGKLWGQVFMDYYYVAHQDSLGRGTGQYSNGGKTPITGEYAKNRNELQYRRIYIGYNYDIAPKFSAELLLSSEKDVPGGDVSGTGAGGAGIGSLTQFIKYANIRWKGIFPGSDVVVGQMATPAFATSSEPVWGYRSVEKTIADFRGTNSYDLGISLQGKFDPKKGNYGYNVMFGNGTKAAPADTVKSTNPGTFKTIYADVYAKFLNKKLIVDLYSDYTLTFRRPGTPTTSSFEQSRNMVKLMVGYTDKRFAVGVEGFITNLSNQMNATGTAKVDTLSPIATGLSIFARGSITSWLNIFARWDGFNPNNSINNGKYSAYNSGGFANSAGGGYTVAGFAKESFISAGLDFTPNKNVHIIPNIWYNSFASQAKNAAGDAKKDNTTVYRITFAYTFGK